MSFYFPKEAAAVLVQQRSYANTLLDKYFTSTPKKKSELFNNTDYINELSQYHEAAFKTADESIFGALGDDFKCNSVLDIGCGIGVSSLAIYHSKKSNDKPDLYLLDGSPNKIHDDKLRIAKKGICKKDYEFSFDIFAAQQFLIGNGVRQENINFLAPSPRSISNLKEIDLIISFTSWFWHYPCETYWDSVIKVLHSKSALMVDIFYTYSDDYISLLRRHFIDVDVFQEFEDSTRLRVCAKYFRG